MFDDAQGTVEGGFAHVKPVFPGSCEVRKTQQNIESSFAHFVKEAVVLKHISKLSLPGVIELNYIAGTDLYLKRYDYDLSNYTCHDLSEIIEITYKLLLTIYNLSQIGVTHRDIKPGNILLNERTGETVLCDFGLAYIGESKMQDGLSICVQTDGYRSPEVMLGDDLEASYDLSLVDIWSLGCTVLDLLSGLNNTKYKLFYSNKMYSYECFQNHLDELWPQIAQHIGLTGFCRILKNMLTVNPRDRPSAETLLEDPFWFSIGLKYRTVKVKLHDPIHKVNKFSTSSDDMRNHIQALSDKLELPFDVDSELRKYNLMIGGQDQDPHIRFLVSNMLQDERWIYNYYECGEESSIVPTYNINQILSFLESCQHDCFPNQGQNEYLIRIT
jgi:serine/threonine protein kinase